MQPYRLGFAAMASACEIVLAGMDGEQAAACSEATVNEVRRIESKYSRYRSDSIVSRINAAAGRDWIECDEETAALLDYADTLYKSSDGLFDATSGILRKAWNFLQPAVPSAATLAPLLELIDWRQMQREAGRVRLGRAGMEVDFGGFGKEYAADRAADILLAMGARSGYVNLAGDMRILGPKPDGEPWLIGIQDPRRQGTLMASIPIGQGGIATSGDYERYFELDGQRYCHILDIRTGMPVGYWRSVSVLSPRALVAGSCSTIAMLKQDDGIAFLEDAGVSYLAVDKTGQVHYDKQLS